MKPLLFILFAICLGGCANNQQNTIVTICNGVKSAENACSSAVEIAGKCSKCGISIESTLFENDKELGVSSFEVQ